MSTVMSSTHVPARRTLLPAMISSSLHLQQIKEEENGRFLLIHFYSTRDNRLAATPTIDRFRHALPDLVLANVNIDQCRDIVQEYNITSTPSFVLELNGHVLQKMEHEQVIDCFVNLPKQTTISAVERKKKIKVLSNNQS